MTNGREKFTAEADQKLLSEARAIAEAEGRPLQALIEEALVDLIKKRKQGGPRAHVMVAYLTSLEKFGSLYKKLAE